MTVGGTAIGFGPSDDSNESTLTAIPTSDALLELTTTDTIDELSAVTTTIVASTDGSELDSPVNENVADTGLATEPDIGNQPAPVSSSPVTVTPIDATVAPNACVPDVQSEEPKVAEPQGAAPRSDEFSGDAIAAPATDAAPPTTAWFTDTFEEGAARWTPLSGTWAGDAGTYVQSDASGYDFISQLPVELPEQFALSVDLTPIEGALGGGVVIGQPVAGSRRGATLVDFTDSGRFVRWGTYDADTGQYRYVGGVAVGADFDLSATRTLTLEVRTGRTLVVLDGRALGEFAPVEPGSVGLASSLSAVAFDNVEIVEL